MFHRPSRCGEIHRTAAKVRRVLNTEALERIGALYKIEDAIGGKPPGERRAYREEHARPLLDQPFGNGAWK